MSVRMAILGNNFMSSKKRAKRLNSYLSPPAGKNNNSMRVGHSIRDDGTTDKKTMLKKHMSQYSVHNNSVIRQ